MKGSRINLWEGNEPELIAEAVPYTQPNIIKLVESASGGNFEAFGKLYHLYAEKIYRYVFYMVNNKMTAEDITADVFVKALDKIKSCKGKEATFSAWLYRIAHNLVVDHFRRANKNLHVEIEVVKNLDDPKQQKAGSDLEQQELFEMVSELPKNQQRFVILKFIEGLNNHEVGDIMGKSQVAIRLLQLRAMTALRKKFDRG